MIRNTIAIIEDKNKIMLSGLFSLWSSNIQMGENNN